MPKIISSCTFSDLEWRTFGRLWAEVFQQGCRNSILCVQLNTFEKLFLEIKPYFYKCLGFWVELFLDLEWKYSFGFVEFVFQESRENFCQKMFDDSTFMNFVRKLSDSQRKFWQACHICILRVLRNILSNQTLVKKIAVDIGKGGKVAENRGYVPRE